jgi:ABC-2 type transport system permease protein
MFIPQALLPLVALLYASGVIQDEQEEQTLTYLLIRPLSKWMIYIVKLLAAVITAVVLTAIFTQLTYAAIYYRTGADTHEIITRCIKAIGIHSLAVVAYCSLFGAMSLFTKRTLVVGIMYAAIFEGLLANLPLSIRLITIIYYSRLIAYRVLTFVFTDGFGVHDIAAEAWQLDLANDPKLLEHPTMRTCVIVLVCASLVCTLLAAILCSRREFHVKTPEKAEA